MAGDRTQLGHTRDAASGAAPRVRVRAPGGVARGPGNSGAADTVYGAVDAVYGTVVTCAVLAVFQCGGIPCFIPRFFNTNSTTGRLLKDLETPMNTLKHSNSRTRQAVWIAAMAATRKLPLDCWRTSKHPMDSICHLPRTRGVTKLPAADYYEIQKLALDLLVDRLFRPIIGEERNDLLFDHET
ncbi:hypothetical protein K439DRAFT_1624339 [Ramaria rubella]|nr:hypothetical protein K439DRAFT_1624339 [Ramaria rubella]